MDTAERLEMCALEIVDGKKMDMREKRTGTRNKDYTFSVVFSDAFHSMQVGVELSI